MHLAGLVSTKIHLIITIKSAVPTAIFWPSNKIVDFLQTELLRRQKPMSRAMTWSAIVDLKRVLPPIYIIKENQK